MSAPAPSIARRDPRSIAVSALLLALSGAGWIILWAWSASPYARYVDHGHWADGASFIALCRALPAGQLWLPASLYALGWLVMIAAMMLPTVLPVAGVVHRITRGEPYAAMVLALLLGGYATAWFAFGLVAHVADVLVAEGLERAPWLAFNGWAVGAAVLACAGLFQFSRLKYRCLDACHAPTAFVLARWRGRSHVRDGWRIGWDHGLFCIGCCWALMLLMFVVGTASLGWMMLLAALMAAEKNLPQGRRLRTPLGAALLGCAAAVVLAHLGAIA